MTLTIEQVRDTRFHLARRNGYDPADVDTFVDKVETTLVALAEENATLQQQVATLSSGGGADDGELQRALEVLALLGQDRHGAAQAHPRLGAAGIELGSAPKACPRGDRVARHGGRAPLLDQLRYFLCCRLGHQILGSSG